MEGTEKLATFIAQATFDKIPRAAIDTAKRSILDGIGVALAGFTEPAGKIMTEFIKELGGKPMATVIGGGFRTSPPLAALANGTLAHAMDYDDVSEIPQMSHPTASLLPAVLALGEVRKASGKRVLESYLVGCETWTKVASAIPSHSDKGWHSASTMGSLGAAGGAAHMLGLDSEKIKTALSLAFSQASGSKRQFGTMAKPFHAGNGARTGVMAAMLAERGFSAEQMILEGDFGFKDLFSGQLGGGEKYDLKEAMRNIGDFDEMVNLGVGIKPYPCRGTNHSSIDAVLYLVNQHNISPEEVESIECTISRKLEVGYTEVKTPLEAKFSLAFCVAVAILDRKVGVAQFTEEKVFNPKVQELIRKVKVNFDPNLIKGEGKGKIATASVLTLRLKGGKTYSHRVNKARGTKEVPLSMEELIAKYRDCAELVLSEKKIKKSIELIENLEGLGDINELMGVLSR